MTANKQTACLVFHITLHICSLAVFHNEIESRRLGRETETEPKIGVNLNNLVCTILVCFFF